MTAARAIDFNWAPERALTLKAARRRSRVVVALRRFFVAGASASFAAAFVFLSPVWSDFAIGEHATAEPARIVNPRFIGRSEDGGRYQLSAEIAQRPPGESALIELVHPVYRTEAGVVILAPHGVYNERNNTMVFDGETIFWDRAGNRLTTQGMVLDLERGALAGQGRVTGAAPG
jgi:lipopolysaccharide export system protein LptC